MGIYDRYFLPLATDLACSQSGIMALRARVVPQAAGRVLEVGVGSALNLSLYDPARIEKLWLLEPSAGMRSRAEDRVKRAPLPVNWLEAPAERIPLPDASVDTVLLTFTLCTVGDPAQALAEMRRVLAPEGRLLFCEHGLAPDPGVRRWQWRLTPLWRRIAGGCHLDRPVRALIEAAGFEMERIETVYLDRAPRFVGFVSFGVARQGPASVSDATGPAGGPRADPPDPGNASAVPTA